MRIVCGGVRSCRSRVSARASGSRPAAAAAQGTNGREPGLVVRLRLRLVRQRPAVEVPDRHRRVDEGRSCDRSRRPHPLGPCDRGAVASGQRARRAALSALRQRSRVRVASALLKWIVDAGHRDRPDRSRQALAEWRDGELQRQVPRRVPEPRMVPVALRGEDHHRDMAQALQRGAAAFEPRLFDAGRVRREAQGERRSTRAGNGPGRCGRWGLRAPARCITVPQGTFEGTTEASILKLKLVR